MNDKNEGIPMGNAEWQKIVKSIPVVCDITETTAEGVVRQALKAVFEKNGLPMDKLDAMTSTIIAHTLSDIGFAAMHGFAILHGYVSGLEKLLVGIGVFRPGSSIDFNAIDGSRTHIVFVIVCSSPDHVGYRQFLSRLCKCLIYDDIVSRLAAVSTSNDLEALLVGVDDKEEK